MDMEERLNWKIEIKISCLFKTTDLYADRMEKYNDRYTFARDILWNEFLEIMDLMWIRDGISRPDFIEMEN